MEGLSPLVIAGICFAGLTAFAALALAFARRLVHAAFLLFAVLFGVAGLFAVAGATLVAMSQLLVYVGGILVLMVFGLMLTDRALLQYTRANVSNLGAGLAVAAGLGAVLFWMLSSARLTLAVSPMPSGENALILGERIFSAYAFPFEAIGMLLLVVLIGAAAIARAQDRSHPADSDTSQPS